MQRMMRLSSCGTGKDAAKAQLENGVITANDYLREVNAEDQSRQTLITP